MPMVNAKCTNCGGTLQVDDDKEAAVCPFCGSAFIVEKAVQNFNITNNIVTNNNVQADVVNIYSTKRDDFLIEGGLLKKYKGAETEVVIPEGVMEIGERAFADMKYITKVTFPKSLRTIKKEAFDRCSSLQFVKIGDDVSIERDSFTYCTALDSIYLGNNVTAYHSFSCWKKNLKVISISTINYMEPWPTFGEGIDDIIDFFEIRDDAVLSSMDTVGPLLYGMHIKTLKIGNNVQLLAPLFGHCKIDHISVGRNLQCNGWPLGAMSYGKISPKQFPTAVFVDAADLKRNAAQRVKKLYVAGMFVRKKELVSLCNFVIKKGTLQTCVCCGKDKLVQKDGKTICKKCGATYVFENPNG